MKTCTACNITQPLSEFYGDKRRADGKQSHCKSCKASRYGDSAKERSRKWCRNNPDRKREQTRKWREENRGHYLETTRSYHRKRLGNRDPLKAWPTTECSYNAAHLRVKAVRGRAHTHSCIDCGGSAQEWSYRGGSDLELMEPRDLPRGRFSLVAYSPDPADYDPRCKSCHTKFDLRERVSA